MADPNDGILAGARELLKGDTPALSRVVAAARARLAERAEHALSQQLDAVLQRRQPEPLIPPRPGPDPARRPPPSRPVVRLEVAGGDGHARRVHARPPLARHQDVAALADVTVENDRRAFEAIERLTDAVERLATSHDELSRRVDALQEQSDLGLVDLVERVSAMRSRVRDLSTRSVRLVRSAQATRAAVRLERRRRQIIAMEGQLDRLASIVQSAQSAAYSQKGSVLAPNNVRLAANALVWGLLGPALRAFGVVASTELNPAAIVAPLGSFVSGQLLLSGRAPVRFISDITRFDPADNSISLSLRNYLGDAQWRALVAREDVPVVVTELDPIGLGNLRAVVRSGVLTITAPIGLIAFMAGGGAPEPPRVAWVVDLGAVHG